LRFQASRLTEKSRGLLEGAVAVTDGPQKTSIQLDLIAPAVNGYRHRLLTAEYRTDLAYPVRVWAECYEVPRGSLVKGNYGVGDDVGYNPARVTETNYRIAASERDFLDVVAEVLRSAEVRSIIDSLIARSNENSLPKAG
jgi:hypothetical protein